MIRRFDVRKVDNATHWINLYPVDNAIVLLIFIHWIVIYPLDSAIHRFERSAPGACNIIIATEVYEKIDRVKSWASEVQFMYNVHISLNLCRIK